MKYTHKVMVDAKAVIDFGVRRYHWQTADDYAKDLRVAAADLMDFLRDHRSRDGYRIDIESVDEEHCQHGSHEAEDADDNGEPVCCRKAYERWQAEEYCKLSQQP